MLRVTDAPGYYAAFPWGVTRGKRGRPERAATPLAHALYIPLSLPPHLPTPGRLFGHGGNIVRAVHRGPPPERSGEGGSSLQQLLRSLGQLPIVAVDILSTNKHLLAVTTTNPKVRAADLSTDVVMDHCLVLLS